jgi:hypothetical protein
MLRRGVPSTLLCTAFGALLALSPGRSDAQAPDGFDGAMEATLAEAGAATPLLRCTALFRAFRLYAGEQSEIGRTAAEHETGLAVAGVVIWQDETGTGDLDAAFAAIVPMVGAATDLYLARMAGNQEARGIVFDDTLEEELAACDALHDEIAGAL